MRLLTGAALGGLTAMLAAVSMASLPAGAQTTLDTVGPHSAFCGSWQNGTFVPSGACVEETVTTTTTVAPAAVAVPGAVVVPVTTGRIPGRVSGTITFVKGHLVTLQQANQQLVINDQPGLGAQATGRIAVGRSVVAHGYWDNGVFYATRIETATN